MLTRSNKRTLLDFTIIGLLTWSVLMTYTAFSEKHDIESLKNSHNAQIAAYKDEALKAHIQYEGARGEISHLERDLADRDRRLRDATTREAEARARASRSRRVATLQSTVSDESRVSPQPIAGGLHDITMYCPTGNTTASGKWPTRGMVATMDRAIPFGTHVLIAGIGEFVVEDRIGYGSEYDIFTPDCSEAERFGRLHRAVSILN